MQHESASINKQLSHSLYRGVLRLVAVAERPHTRRIVQTRWVEFVPPQVWIAPGEALRHIARRSFEAPYTPTSVRNAFTFLKEARETLFSVWVLAEWERLESQDQFDLYDGLVLMSAALYGARANCDSQHSFETSIKDYQVCMRSYVQGLAKRVREEVDVNQIELGNAEDLRAFVELIRKETALERRDSEAEDFSLISLLQNQRASEYVLNLLLLLVLRVLDVHSTAVGNDLAYRWVRVMPRNGSPMLFASWTYGVMGRKDVERIMRPSDKHWYRSVPWDTVQRKSVVCALLRRQLGCLPVSADPTTKRIATTCKEQILFLLS